MASKKKKIFLKKTVLINLLRYNIIPMKNLTVRPLATAIVWIIAVGIAVVSVCLSLDFTKEQ